jgi:hypothetical protein
MLRCLSLGLTLWAGAISAQTLESVSATPITAEAATLGGLSAIETTDGSTALTVSDRGQFFDLTLERDTAGNIIAARAAPSAKFTPSEHDTEGLAIGPSGAFAAFEGPATVRHINGAALPRHPDFRKMGSNAALEALAIDAQGRLFTLEESTGGADVPFALYIFSQGVWSKPHSIPRQHGFLPVGADFGADGRLYLLERQFTPFGFRSQIRRFDLDATPPTETTLLTTYALQHGNLEGIAVWQDANGATRITMVSDNNFLPIQRNQVVEYLLSE